jgi:mRNA (2'-O-methyladenosine-N6-)-methyltransferase
MADPNRQFVGGNMPWIGSGMNFAPAGLYAIPPAYSFMMPPYPTHHAMISGQTPIQPFASTANPIFPTSPPVALVSTSEEPLPTFGIKKVRLTMKAAPSETEDPHETPAMRLKSRPKRPTLNLIQPDPYSDCLSEDEDYVAPRTASHQISKNYPDRSSSTAVPGPNEFSQEIRGPRLPNNAYTSIAHSAWPTLTRVQNPEDNDGRSEIGSIEAQQIAMESQESEMTGNADFRQTLSPAEPNSSAIGGGMDIDRNKSRGSETGEEGDEESRRNRVVLSVPEYDRYMESCDVEEFLTDLNYPESAPIEGLSGWVSTLERKMWKEGLSPYELPTADWEDAKWKEGTYINCDLRYYDLSLLGKFDVVLIDPPWRIRGAQNVSDEKTIFNNNRFTMQYNTMSNEEIMDLDVGNLSERGFIFLWTINSQLQTAFECLNRWGYTFVDRITWVKKTNRDSVFIGQGYYLLHSTEICLIGAKKDAEGNYLEVVQKVSNDLIFASTQKKSQKPEQMYHIIERMFPGARKVEVFARNHNIRPGWLSIGNQLGPHYNWAHDDITCDECKRTIVVGQVRFKHRLTADRDLCRSCFTKLGERADDYFELANRVDEQTFHEYYECNSCGANPLWGIRFSCLSCPDLDLCESCHDQRLVPEALKQTHNNQHKFQAFETPEIAGGLAVHRHRCLGCNTFPIVGCRFKCVECLGNMSLCQKCFFAKKTPRNHTEAHQMHLITEPVLARSQVRCDICRVKPIVGARYKCQQCLNFEICGSCHDSQRPPPPNYASHKPTHAFTKIIPDAEAEAAPSKEHRGGNKGWGPADPDEDFD